jgi:hypothetical protein
MKIQIDRSVVEQLAQELTHWWLDRGIGNSGDALYKDFMRVAQAALTAAPAEPVAYLAWRDGKPCYEGDDAVCEDAVWPCDVEDDRTSMPVYLAPQPQREPLTDQQLKEAFGKLYPQDLGLIELAENNRDYALESIGARHHWTAFKAGAKAIESMHGIGVAK